MPKIIDTNAAFCYARNGLTWPGRAPQAGGGVDRLEGGVTGGRGAGVPALPVGTFGTEVCQVNIEPAGWQEERGVSGTHDTDGKLRVLRPRPATLKKVHMPPHPLLHPRRPCHGARASRWAAAAEAMNLRGIIREHSPMIQGRARAGVLHLGDGPVPGEDQRG